MPTPEHTRLAQTAVHLKTTDYTEHIFTFFNESDWKAKTGAALELALQ